MSEGHVSKINLFSLQLVVRGEFVILCKSSLTNRRRPILAQSEITRELPKLSRQLSSLGYVMLLSHGFVERRWLFTIYQNIPEILGCDE